MKTVSIITTFYNAEEYIEQALLSVFNQKYTDINIEYILVNDCSADDSIKLAHKLIKKYKNKENLKIKLCDLQKNIGCGAARKYGIDEASGDYFMFLDADDYYINNDFVQRAYNTITSENADIVEYGVIFNEPNGRTINMCVDSRKTYNNWHDSLYWMFKNNTIKFNVWSKIYTREIVKSFPYDTTREYEDIRTIPIWVMNAKKLIVEPTLEINYRAAKKSIIRDNGLRTRLGTITAMTEVCELFKEDINIVKALYGRAMIDLCAVMENKNSLDEGFNEMSKLNTKLLSYIYPDTYKNITYNLPDNDNSNEDFTILNTNIN